MPCFFCGKRRITILSPKTVGMVETRTSTSPADNFMVKRPSWGWLVILILSPEINLIRANNLLNLFFSKVAASCKIPSKRTRTTMSCSSASTCKSEASNFKAAPKRKVTKSVVEVFSKSVCKARKSVTSACTFSISSSLMEISLVIAKIFGRRSYIFIT